MPHLSPPTSDRVIHAFYLSSHSILKSIVIRELLNDPDFGFATREEVEAGLSICTRVLVSNDCWEKEKENKKKSHVFARLEVFTSR